MNNFLLNHKKQQSETTLREHLNKTEKQSERRTNINSMASNSHRNRLIMYSSNDNGQFSSDIASTLLQGSFPLLHIDNHDFRDREQKKQRDPYGGIYNRTQKLQMKPKNQFSNDYIKIDEYFQQKQERALQRQRSINLEGPALRFGLNPRTENERIINDIGRVNSMVDIQGKNMNMVHFPSWKDVKKDKWVGQENFNLTTNNFTLVQQAAWPLTEIEKHEKYIDGYEVIGDLSRKREQQKEGKRSEFISVIRNDPWESTLHISKSLRTFKAEQALGINNYDTYSKNNKIRNYQSTLIASGSLNHFVPFNHSNSERSKEMLDLMPVSEKLYNQSLKHYQIETDHNVDLKQKSQNTSGLKLDFVGENNNQSLEDNIKVRNKLGSIKSIASMNETKMDSQHTEGNNFWKNTPYYRPTDEEVKTVVSKYFQVQEKHEHRNHPSNSSIHTFIKK